MLVLAWLLIVAGTFFSYAYIANPGQTFPGALTTVYSSHQNRPATVTLASCCAQRQQTFFRRAYWHRSRSFIRPDLGLGRAVDDPRDSLCC